MRKKNICATKLCHMYQNIPTQDPMKLIFIKNFEVFSQLCMKSLWIIRLTAVTYIRKNMQWMCQRLFAFKENIFSAIFPCTYKHIIIIHTNAASFFPSKQFMICNDLATWIVRGLFCSPSQPSRSGVEYPRDNCSPAQGYWNCMIFDVPSNLSHSMIPQN